MQQTFKKFHVLYIFLASLLILLNVDACPKNRVKRAGDAQFKLTKNIIDNKGRLVTKHGTITYKGIGKGSGTVFKNTQEIRNLFQEKGGIQGRDHKGHIVARLLGGKGTKWNLFSQHGKINNGHFKSQENKMLNIVKEHETVISQHDLSYEGNSKRPNAISVVLKSTNGKTLGSYAMVNPENYGKQHQNLKNNERMAKKLIQKSIDLIRAQKKPASNKGGLTKGFNLKKLISKRGDVIKKLNAARKQTNAKIKRGGLPTTKQSASNKGGITKKPIYTRGGVKKKLNTAKKPSTTTKIPKIWSKILRERTKI